MQHHLPHHGVCDGGADDGKRRYEVTDAGDATALANAITAAKDGETIKLTAPIAASITIPADKNITLDLNGQTLTGEAGKHAITKVAGGLAVKGSTGTAAPSV